MRTFKARPIIKVAADTNPFMKGMSRINSSYNKKLDEEFPSFSSLPRRNQHSNVVSSTPASSAPIQTESIKQKSAPQPTLMQQLDLFGISSPESIF